MPDILSTKKTASPASTAGQPLLVFDLDGTLADTADDLVATVNAIIGREGLAAIPNEQIRRMVGAGARALLVRAYAAHGQTLEPARLEALFTDFLAHYEENICVHSRLFPGVIDALDQFADAGWRFAVCTNKIERPSIKLLDALGILNRFDFVCGQDTFAFYKPDPRTLMATIAKAGGDSAQSVMIGDSRTDIDTAKNAGIPVVAVNFGYTDVPVEDLGPDRVIAHFHGLWGAVESLGLGQAENTQPERLQSTSA